MATYLQQDRPLRLKTTLAPNMFIVRGFLGTEAVSQPYRFVLDLLSDDAAIDGARLLRTEVTLTVDLPDGQLRNIHGYITRFVEMGRHEEETFYQAEVAPRLWFASLARDCRIFQGKSVQEIVEVVLKAHGVQYQFKLSGSYSKREYCVQYHESDLDFVSRLLEEEGIFYWFDHSGAREKMVLADSNGSIGKCPAQETAHMALQTDLKEDVVLELRREHAVHTSKVTLNAYSYMQPRLSLKESVPAKVAGFNEEAYMFADHETADEGRRLARVRIEAEEAREQMVKGRSACRAFTSGSRFKLQSHFNSKLNTEYVLTEVRHEAVAAGVRTGGSSPFSYKNEFTAIPFSVPCRPLQVTPKPVIGGTQTALVVGPKGEEIYSDSNGRVKVQFFWDRLGAKDDKSSLWVRVSTAWAGKQWGAVHIPRIGQEVVVAFLEGDPDRPLIVGSVYNADEMPPYQLPANQTQSGVKSRSSKQGATDNFNEIRLEDKKGSEHISVQAEKDLATLVKNDEKRDVGHDRTTTVKNKEMRTVKEGEDVTVIEKGDQTIEVKKGKQVVTVGEGDQTIEVKKGKQTVTVGSGDQEITIGKGDRTVHVKGGAHKRMVDQGDDSVVIKMGNREIKLSMGNMKTQASLGKISYDAMQGIELKVGQNSIKIDQMGVTIKGLMVKVEGSVQTEVKGLLTNIKADAMLQATGAIIMIG